MNSKNQMAKPSLEEEEEEEEEEWLSHKNFKNKALGLSLS